MGFRISVQPPCSPEQRGGLGTRTRQRHGSLPPAPLRCFVWTRPSGSAEPYEQRREPGAHDHDQRGYFHSQALLFVFPSASALYSKTTATVFRRRKFGDSL